MTLHQKRFVERVENPGCFSDPRFEPFLHRATRDLTESGRAEIVWCERNGRPFVAQLYLLGDRTAYMYQSGFDPEFSELEPGYLLYTHVFQTLSERGFDRLDFLRGDEPYKAQWNAAPVSLHRYRCVPPRWMPRLRQEALNAGRSLKNLTSAYLRVFTSAADVARDAGPSPAKSLPT